MRSPCKTGAAVVVVLATTGCRGVLGLGEYEFVDAGGVVCEPGVYRCSGNALEKCDEAGQEYKTERICAAGKCNAEEGKCSAGCPAVSGGPQLVTVSGDYCMDATEVTRDQYALMLGSLSSVGQAAPCLWNTDFTPTCKWPPGADGSHPVVCVDWCDAYAFCNAVGKRLCGKIGGGANLFGDYKEASKSQWYNVCSSGGANDYPYGDTYSGTTCNGGDAKKGGTVPVGTMSGCASQGVYDLSGNVWEWEDSCDGTSGKNDYCRLRGGSFDPGSGNVRCANSNFYLRFNQFDFIGFRCCAS